MQNDFSRIVVKIGTNVVCRENGEFAMGRLYSIIEELVDCHRSGKQIILVSSGSISLGMESLRLDDRPETLVDKQACAAIGQTRLMAAYQHALDRFDIATAQVLLTEEDFVHRGRYLNLRNTLTRLLELGVLPIVNENDTVSTSEIETHIEGQGSVVFGDNDVLSALVASKLGAELLILLSDVDGFYDGPPDNPTANKISTITEITPEIVSLASGKSRGGRGGMRTKLQAAKIATHSGSRVVLAQGSKPGVIKSILQGEEVGTMFIPRKPLSSRKRWIAFASTVSGTIRVNKGARDALVKRKASLLFAGVDNLDNDFNNGDIVSILDESGDEFARGIVNYSSKDAKDLVGRKSDEIIAIRKTTEATSYPAEFIHCDNIVILQGPENQVCE